MDGLWGKTDLGDSGLSSWSQRDARVRHHVGWTVRGEGMDPVEVLCRARSQFNRGCSCGCGYVVVVVVVVVMLWLWLWLWFRVEGMGRGCFLSGGDIYFFGWRDNKRLDRIWACLHAQITTLGMLQVPHSA